MSTFSITVGDLDCEIDIESFDGGNSGSYWDPPEPGEIMLANTVEYTSNEGSGKMTWNTFVELVAHERAITLEQADSLIHDKAYDQECERRREDFDDRW